MFTSCFHKFEHGTIAGVILFFTCAGAALGPVAMGALSDAVGHARYGFMLATAYSAVLCAGLAVNWIFNPARTQLSDRDAGDYAAARTSG